MVDTVSTVRDVGTNGRLDEIVRGEMFNHLTKRLKGTAKIRRNVSLENYSSIRIGGIADIVVLPYTKEAIIETILYCQENGIPYYVSGLGADTIFGNIPVLINTTSLDSFIGSTGETERIISADEVEAHDGVVTAQAGVVWGRKPAIRPADSEGLMYQNPDALLEAYMRNKSMAWVLFRNSLEGVEGLADVPGTVGAGVYLNAGAGFDQYAAQYVEEIRLIDLNGKEITVKKGESKKTGLRRLRSIIGAEADVSFAYRDSSLQEKEGYIVYAVTFRFPEKRDQEDIKQRMYQDYEYRLGKIPPGLSIGSVFKRRGEDGSGYGVDDGGNPIRADVWIRHAGCAGYEHPSGRIVISEKYPLVFINTGNATLQDFIETVEHVEDTVYSTTGKRLVREARFLPPI